MSVTNSFIYKATWGHSQNIDTELTSFFKGNFCPLLQTLDSKLLGWKKILAAKLQFSEMCFRSVTWVEEGLLCPQQPIRDRELQPALLGLTGVRASPTLSPPSVQLRGPWEPRDRDERTHPEASQACWGWRSLPTPTPPLVYRNDPLSWTH